MKKKRGREERNEKLPTKQKQAHFPAAGAALLERQREIEKEREEFRHLTGTRRGWNINHFSHLLSPFLLFFVLLCFNFPPCAEAEDAPCRRLLSDHWACGEQRAAQVLILKHILKWFLWGSLKGCTGGGLG